MKKFFNKRSKKSYRSGAIGGLSSGSWEGFYDGFSSGFMTGAFIGGVTGAVSNAIKVGQAASMWDKRTFKSGYSSMKHHYGTRRGRFWKYCKLYK